MRHLALIAGLLAFILIALRVPVETRDWGYFVNGLVVLAAFGMVATDRRR